MHKVAVSALVVSGAIIGVSPAARASDRSHLQCPTPKMILQTVTWNPLAVASQPSRPLSPASLRTAQQPPMHFPATTPHA